jgi:hypothetical protein
MRKPNEIERLSDGTIRIKLTKGQFSIINSLDYDKIKNFRWFAMKPHKTFYAVCCIGTKKLTHVLMHNLIFPCNMGHTPDHKNRNGLDNRRENLRQSTISQNNRNQSINTRNNSGFTGVCWNKNRNCWWSRICFNGRHIHIGLFNCLAKAISARKQAEKKYFGEFAPI